MRRFLVTILSVLYMAGAISATVHIHYCMNRFMSASLIDKDADRCDKCGMKKDARKNGCCKDEHKTFKTGIHQFAKASFDVSHQHVIIPYQYSYNAHQSAFYTPLIATSVHAHAPPACWRTCPIYIQVQNFRI
jgi:hypothetical protein